MANIFQNQIDLGMSVCESILMDNVHPQDMKNEIINDHYMVVCDSHKYARKVTPDYVYDFVYGMYPRIYALHSKSVVQEIKHVNVTVEMLESIIDRGLNKIAGRIGDYKKQSEPVVKAEVKLTNREKHRFLLVGWNSDQEAAIIANKDPRIKFRCISYTALAELKQVGEFDAVLVSRFIDHSTWNMARKKATFAHFCNSPNEAKSKIREYLDLLK